MAVTYTTRLHLNRIFRVGLQAACRLNTDTSFAPLRVHVDWRLLFPAAAAQDEGNTRAAILFIHARNIYSRVPQVLDYRPAGSE